MSVSQNEHYIFLLYNNPEKLVVELQPFIRNSIQQMSYRGWFAKNEIDDVIQTINQELLSGKIEKMRQQYNHSVYFLTYFTRILSRMCLALLRKAHAKKKINPVRWEDGFNPPDREIDVQDKLIIDEEIRRLGYYLRLFFSDYHKLIICLKAFVRYPLSVAAIEKELDCGLPEKFSEYDVFFKEVYETASDKEVNEKLIRIFNFYHGKKSNTDSLRKYNAIRTKQLINFLNSGFNHDQQTRYTKDTLKILLLKYFEYPG